MFEAHSIAGFHHIDGLEQREIITDPLWPALGWTPSYHLGTGKGCIPTNTSKEKNYKNKNKKIQAEEIQNDTVGFWKIKQNKIGRLFGNKCFNVYERFLIQSEQGAHFCSQSMLTHAILLAK